MQQPAGETELPEVFGEFVRERWETRSCLLNRTARPLMKGSVWCDCDLEVGDDETELCDEAG